MNHQNGNNPTKQQKLGIMKNLFYIRNTKTDQNFDTNEMKFYPSNWQPTYEEDKQWLEGLINEDPEKFENCVVETVEISD